MRLAGAITGLSTVGHRLLEMLPERPHFLLANPTAEAGLITFALATGCAQRWLVADPDTAVVDSLFERLEAWARQVGLTATWPGRALLIHAPGGAWRIEGHAEDPANFADDDLVDAVIVEGAAAAAMWRAYDEPQGRPPLLALRCSTGRIDWFPRDAADRRVQPPRPPYTPAAIMHRLRAAGCDVAMAPSDLRLPFSAQDALQRLIDQTAVRAPVKTAARASLIAGWQERRRRQALAGRLAVHIGIRDILALPPED